MQFNVITRKKWPWRNSLHKVHQKTEITTISFYKLDVDAVLIRIIALQITKNEPGESHGVVIMTNTSKFDSLWMLNISGLVPD